MITDKELQFIKSKLIKEDKIYDEDLLIELTDHIACKLVENESEFEISFNKYWNSVEKVRLITEAKKVLEAKKEKVNGYFLKQFISPQIILFFVFNFFLIKELLKHLSNDVSLITNIFLGLMIITLLASIITSTLKKSRFFYVKSLMDSVSIFFIVSLQLMKRYVIEDLEVGSGILISVVFISLYLTSILGLIKTLRYAYTLDNYKINLL